MSRKRFSRPEGDIPERLKILVICEGEKTEVNYFQGFRATAAKIKPIGTGSNGTTLIRKAIKEIELQGGTTKFHQIWCIFDKDQINNDTFNSMVKSLRDEGVEVGYSNISFELWVLLHFEDVTEALTQRDILRKLETHFPDGYKKNSPELHKTLQPHQEIAVTRAKALAQHPDHIAHADRNPCSLIWKLVEILNKYSF